MVPHKPKLVCKSNIKTPPRNMKAPKGKELKVDTIVFLFRLSIISNSEGDDSQRQVDWLKRDTNEGMKYEEKILRKCNNTSL